MALSNAVKQQRWRQRRQVSVKNDSASEIARKLTEQLDRQKLATIIRLCRAALPKAM
jgi:hypothetical protein